MKIEKNIPIPDTKYGGKKYEWEGMKVGDSFVAYCQKVQTIVSAGIGYSKRRTGGKWKFTVRKEKAGQYRIWRIK